MATTVPEPLDVGTWPQDIQIAVRDELIAIVGGPSINLIDMNDTELSNLLRNVHSEMASRPGAITTIMDSVSLGGNIVVMARP
jgi:hypothetical protein